MNSSNLIDEKPQNPLAFASQGPDGGQYGMTLRDYFAGQALAGLCVYVNEKDRMDLAEGIKGGKFIAQASYALADALLKVRE